MTSKVQVAKLALSHIGDRYDITSLDESSTEAEQFNLVFEDLRRALLREHPWKFAKKYSKPSSLSGTPPAEWDYMFTYPTDGLKVRRLVNPLDPVGDKLPPIPFDIGLNSSDVKCVFTNEEAPELEYTKDIDDPVDFDSNFITALSWRLAEHVVMPITGETRLAQLVAQRATYWVNVAKMQDANEGIEREQTRDPDWIRNR